MTDPRIDCDLRKWDGSSHYRFGADLLGRDDHGTWVGCRPPTPFTGPDGPGEFPYGFVILLPTDGWWVASFNDMGSTIHTYVDIATPPTWPSATHVTFVDLDLDVIRYHDGRLLLDDEDEFEEHLVHYRYPDDVIATARRTATELMDAVASRREPFGTVGERWLATL
jgi:uncharacterized protein